MRSRTWVPAAAALLLVVGVLATRGGTAAAEDDLAPPVADPPPSAVPSPVPSAEVDEAVVVEANGIEGMRLGTAGRDLLNPFDGSDGSSGADPLEPPDGCSLGYGGSSGSSPQNWEGAAWLVDGLVSAVVLTRWDSAAEAVPGVTTWLGPTLGSPVQAASELPGARTTRERPFGPGGPVVTVVLVPGDGVEVVFSDASYDQASLPESARGRVTSIEVRHPRARPCSMQALQESYPWAPPGEAATVPVAIGLDGLAAAPFGTPTDVVRALPGVETEGGPGSAGCEAFHLATSATTYVRLVTVDGAVTSVQANGSLGSELGVAAGDDVDAVRAAYPHLLDGGLTAQGGTAEVVVGDRVVGIDLWPAQAWVPEVDIPVTGGPPLVQSVSVRDGAVTPSRLC